MLSRLLGPIRNLEARQDSNVNHTGVSLTFAAI
jgi:hypothetical protein